MRIALVGNYPADRQESMLRYADLLQGCLVASGHQVRAASPRVHLAAAGTGGWRKWVGHADKYLLNMPRLGAASTDVDLVHICDHSNSLYIPRRKRVPHVVTCHDLIAVRGALGEVPDAVPGITGRVLQSAVLAGLRRADAIACVSEGTRQDLLRLVPEFSGPVAVVPNALDGQFRMLEATGQLPLPAVLKPRSYLLMVGSSHRRKNRETAIRALARAAPHWPGCLAVAGEPVTGTQWALARELGVADRVVELGRPDDAMLAILYNQALALLFPSRHEGFGWPLIEAQACGCPVIASDCAPMPEVTGGAALHCDADDDSAWARAIVVVASNASRRARLVEAGLANAQRYSPAAMAAGMQHLYAQLPDRAVP